MAGLHDRPFSFSNVAQPFLAVLLDHLKRRPTNELECAPHFVSQLAEQFQEPLAGASRLDAHPHRDRKTPVKLLGISRGVHQLLVVRLSTGHVQPTNLLPTGAKITSNKNHRRLLPTDSFGSPNRSILGSEWSLRSYAINPWFLRVGSYDATPPTLRFRLFSV